MLTNFMPDKNAIISCFTMASTPNSVDYFAMQYGKFAEKNKDNPQVQSIQIHIKNHADNVHTQYDGRQDAWVGPPKIATDFEHYNNNAGKNAAQMLATQFEKIEVAIAIDDNANFMIGSAVDGKPVNQADAMAMEKIFNAWLVANGMKAKQSIIYASNDEGLIPKDKNGQEVKVSISKFKQLITDRKNGLTQFFGKNGIQSVINVVDYPKTAVKPSVEKQETQPAAAAPPPQQPQAADNPQNNEPLLPVSEAISKNLG